MTSTLAPKGRADVKVLIELEDPYAERDGVVNEAALTTCVVCDQPATKRSTCCGSWFCSRECQKEDWPMHKPLCDSLRKEFTESNRPPNHVRAIIFPTDAPRPSFVWLHNSDRDSFDKSISDAVHVPLYGRSPCEMEHGVDYGNINGTVRHREIGRGLRWFPYSLYKNQPGTHMNQSILTLALPGHICVYYGPSVFCAFSGTGDDKKFEDTTMRDFRIIVHFFQTYKHNPCVVNPARFPIVGYGGRNDAQFWPAVKVNCEGDFTRFSDFHGEGRKLSMLEDVLVTSVNISSKPRFPIPLAQLAELPWISQPCEGTNDTLLDKEKLHNYGGRHFTTYTSVDESGNQLGTTYCGSVLVMHQYGASIHVAHVLCFFDFIEAQLRRCPAISTSEPGPRVKRVHTTRGEVASLVTKDEFLAYWMSWMEKEIDKIHNKDTEEEMREEPIMNYRDLRSPYDTFEVDEDGEELAAALKVLGVKA